MLIDLSIVSNPLIDRRPDFAVRDPAVVYHDGVFHLFHTTVDCRDASPVTCLEMSLSSDLVNWSSPRRLAGGSEMFCAPGNVIRHGERWAMCLCSYPIPPGKTWADDSARLYLMESDDLFHWSAPRVMAAQGCQARWARSRRQIDTWLIPHAGKTYALYKTDGQLGLLVSSDLLHWQEAGPDRPVLDRGQMPKGESMENPCVIRHDGEFLMFFSPCREGRGIATARSADLLHWTDIRYLDFPPLPWAPSGPTAPVVLDLREQAGRWVMFFHGEDRQLHPHAAAIGLAWSEDLVNWRCP
jgi:beta-xylosidase